MSVTEQLERLATLHEEGALTTDEYTAAKTAALSAQPQAAAVASVDPGRGEAIAHKDLSAPIPSDGGPEGLNPWLGVWFSPRPTVREQARSSRWFVPMVLVALLGGVRYLDWFESLVGSEMSPFELDYVPFFLTAALVGGGGGLMLWLIRSWLIAVIGRALGGQASAADVRIAYGWVCLPALVAGAGAWTLCFAALGPVAIATGYEDFAYRYLDFKLMCDFMSVSGGLWASLLFWFAISEVHGFSTWRSIGTIILGNVLTMIIAVCGIIGFGMLVSALGTRTATTYSMMGG